MLKVGTDFVNVGVDLQATGNDFTLLGNEFIKLGEASDLKLLSGDFIKLGDLLTNVGATLGAVSDDYLKLGADFQRVSDASDTNSIKLDQVLSQLQFEDHVHKLAQDTSTLDTSLTELGREFLKIDQAQHLKFDSGPPPTAATAGATDLLVQSSVQATTDQTHQDPGRGQGFTDHSAHLLKSS